MRVTSSSQMSCRDIPVPSAGLLRSNSARTSVRSPRPGSASALSISVNMILVECPPELVHPAPRTVAPGPQCRHRHKLHHGRSEFHVGRDDLTQFLQFGPVSAEDGPQDHVQGDPVHRFENPEFFILRPIRAFTQYLVNDDRLVISDAPTVESRCEKPAAIAMPTAVESKYRTRGRKNCPDSAA